jgi:hypothetical protein
MDHFFFAIAFNLHGDGRSNGSGGDDQKRDEQEQRHEDVAIGFAGSAFWFPKFAIGQHWGCTHAMGFSAES